MSRGELTRQHILDHAVVEATRVGLDGLSIGALSTALGLSKSGLFAHFGSKEQLQVQVLEHAAAAFIDRVIRPALLRPRGEPRLQALFDGWLAWGTSSASETSRQGCLFVAASVELDDHPGPARARLLSIQHDWVDLLAQTARGGVREGVFRADLDVEGFAQEMYGILLGVHLYTRLLAEPRAIGRARAAFSRLLADARAPQNG